MKKKKPTITYRLYTPKDRQQFTRCLEESQDYFIKKDTSDWLRRTKDYGKKYTDHMLHELKKYKGQIILALDGDLVVGMIMGTVEDVKGFDLIYYQPDRYGWIYLLYVHPDYRNYHIGSQLLDRIEAFFDKNKCSVIRLEAQGNVEQLVEFYGRRGFKPWLMNMTKRVRPLKKK